MYLSHSSSDRDCGTTATGERKPDRAGLRVPPSGDQPNGVFVIVEMVVLVIVAALAMVSIIVSSGGADENVHATDATTQRLQTARGADARLFVGPSTPAVGRSSGSVPST